MDTLIAAGAPVDVLSVLNAMPGSYLILLPDAPRFTIVGASDAYLDDTNLKRETAIGRGIFESLPNNPNDPAADGEQNLSASLRHVLESRQEHRMADQRYDIRNPISGNWERRIWRPCNKPVFDAAGCVQYLIHWVEDITQKQELQQAAAAKENALREKDESLRNIVRFAPVAIFIFRGHDMVIQTANEKALAMVRRSETIIGKPLLEAIPELRGSQAYATFQQVYRTGTPHYGNEVLVPLEQNGVLENRYFNFAYTPLKEGGRTVGVMDVATEVTEQVIARQRAEAARQETETQKRLYEAISNNTPDLQYVFDLNYRFRYANDALLKMWGQSKEEAMGKGLRQLGYEEWHAAMHEREIDQIVATGDPVRGVVSFPHAELGKRVYDYLLVPVINERGEVEAVAGTTRDITEIKQVEALLEEKVNERTQALENLNKELSRSNANLEEFAHAASHDLKEPVRKIHFFTSQLKERLHTRSTEEEARLFNRIEIAAQRMAQLIEDLLLYSQMSQRPHHTEPVNLRRTIQVVLEDLELDVEEKGAQVTVENLPVVQGYRRQLQQLFQNLLSNAIKYCRAGIPPQIRISAHESQVDDTRYHVIRVQDNGIGFDQAYSDKIFQMFTRLHGKGEYSGTGVGLSIVKKIIENHNGRIEVKSEKDAGSVFSIFLPIAQ